MICKVRKTSHPIRVTGFLFIRQNNLSFRNALDGWHLCRLFDSNRSHCGFISIFCIRICSCYSQGGCCLGLYFCFASNAKLRSYSLLIVIVTDPVAVLAAVVSLVTENAAVAVPLSLAVASVIPVTPVTAIV